MLHQSFKPAKCKMSLKLAIPRIKLLKNKKDVQIKRLKSELAKLLETGQDQTARIRVENLIREVRTKEAYEFIEIYCELIVAWMPTIESQKNCPLDLKEAVTSIIFASPRCADIPELMDVSKQFTAKYGKEFTSAAAELRPQCGVNRMVVGKLSARAPDGLTKIKMLRAIAEEYNVKWESKVFEEKFSMPSTDLLNGPSTFEKASRIQMEPIQMEPIEVHPFYHVYKVPHNIQFPPKPDRNHNKPAVYNLQNPDSASHNPEVRPPEIADARMEFMHSSFSGENWNMEFKDATSAAQAAAESAEIASMAARAAAELANRGKITPECSSNSFKSSDYKLKDEKHQEFSHSYLPNENILNVTVCTAAYRGSLMSGDTSYKDVNVSSTANDWDNEKPLADKFGEESCNGDVILDDKKSESNAGENPFANDDLDRCGVGIETSFYVNDVVYDEFSSDDSYGLVNKDQTRESVVNTLSPDRKSLKNSQALRNPWDLIRDVAEEPSLFSDNLLPMTFDRSHGSGSESEEEIERSKLN